MRGVTLVELLVVLAVGAILLGAAIPGYASFVNFNRLVGMTNDLASALQLTRSEAIKRGKRVTVCKSSTVMNATPSCNVSASWHQGWIVFVDEGEKGVVDSGDQVLRIQGAVTSAALITTSNFSDYLSYLPSGVSQGPNNLGNGALHICLAGSQRSLVVNKIGRVRVDKSTC